MDEVSETLRATETPASLPRFSWKKRRMRSVSEYLYRSARAKLARGCGGKKKGEVSSAVIRLPRFMLDDGVQRQAGYLASCWGNKEEQTTLLLWLITRSRSRVDALRRGRKEMSRGRLLTGKNSRLQMLMILAQKAV